jgi:hypothetical protein
MLTYPWLLYYRYRLVAAAISSLLLTCLAHLWVSGDGFLDFGIFWHGFCSCPVDPNDAYFLLNVPPLIALVVGLIFGLLTPGAVALPAAAGIPGNQLKALSRFFLTRPISRSNCFLLPQAIALTATAVLPAAAFLLLVGWLGLVHAPSLHHLMASIRIIPAVSKLGPHPSFVQVLTAVSASRRYLAAISVGFCAYAILSSQQWLMLSPSKKINALGVVPVFVLFAPMWLIIGQLMVNRMAHVVFLAPGRGASLAYVPSALGIALHLGFAAVILMGCWRVLRTAEL